MSSTTSCWADPLTRKERRAMAKMLARHALRSGKAVRYRRWAFVPAGLVAMSTEFSDLHLDVTERAAWPPPPDTTNEGN